MKLSWIAIFLLVFFLVNVVRFVMAYFGKKLVTVPGLPVAPAAAGDEISKEKIGQALMDVVEKKVFPDVANLYNGIKTQAQLDELVEKLSASLEPFVEDKAEEVVTVDEAVDELLAETETVVAAEEEKKNV